MSWIYPSRRQFLLASSALSASYLVSGLAAQAVDGISQPVPLEDRERGDLLVEPFPMRQVRLLPGVFKQEADINRAYLASLSVDRLMYSFFVQAGIRTDAQPYGGWEGVDCELRGHFAGGHYLSACALDYASTGDETLKPAADRIVAILAQCQKKSGNGYVSAFPSSFFDRLSSQQKVWAPFYTLHKILAGLLDMHTHTGSEQALEVAEGLAGWCGRFCKGLSDSQMSDILKVEYGGMNEALVNLFAMTGDRTYLDTARRFEQPSFLVPLASHRDELKGLHANTNLAKIVGAARMYEVTGEIFYREAVEYFLSEIIEERSYCTGGTSDNEYWRSEPGRLDGELSHLNAECCVSYNLMKVARHLFSWTEDPRWMDYYERVLFNSRLGTQTRNGLKMYYYPLAAGYWKRYNSKDNSFWCCTGTGAEEFAKFTDTIYFRGANGIYINLFIASELEWPEKQFRLRQETNFPNEAETHISVRCERPTAMALNLRVPAWVAEGGSISLNGNRLEVFAKPSAYLSLVRTWQDGDRIDLRLPMQLHNEPLSGVATLRAAMYGPLVLAGLYPGSEAPAGETIGGFQARPVGWPTPASAPELNTNHLNDMDWVEQVSGAPLSFRTANQATSMELIPLNQVAEERYAIYWSLKSKARL